jgi:NAD(P)H dehydrogenase (quinone)
VYELAGDDSYTLAQFAAEIAAQSGEKVDYVNGVVGRPISWLSWWESSNSPPCSAPASESASISAIGRPTTPYQDVIGAALAKR